MTSTDYRRCCCCWYTVPGTGFLPRRYDLPQLEVESHTTILSVSTRTTLTQTFVNQGDSNIPEVRYSFPLYDGVSVVGFRCRVGSKVIVGVVKEKQQARADYKEAVAKGQTAGLLEQLPESSDIFTTKIGNVPAHEKVHVEIVYLGELQHDAETDGSRFTIPMTIVPRYGDLSVESHQSLSGKTVDDSKGISITVDVSLEDGVAVRGVQSPSHPVAITMGRTSQMDVDAFESNHASAALTSQTAALYKDFVIVVLAKGQDTPRALLETHPTLHNQRALMATLVPKFSLPNASPEIVFVVDRSGSMDKKIPLLVQAMRVFLKSLPVGVKFNICSFGSDYSFLFKKSRTYDESSLNEAMSHVETFMANYGGTEMLQPIKATVENRFKDLSLEVMVLTDGEIWKQQNLFDYINTTVGARARFFALGIGNGASTALVQGIARAGGGFAQFVAEGEKMDKRLVRMLKGALTPQICDYTIEVKYGRKASDPDSMDDEFEMVESFSQSTRNIVTDLEKPASTTKKIISLFNTSAKEEPTNPPKGRYDDLPTVNVPAVLQAPHRIPALHAFDRTTLFLLLGPNSKQEPPKSLILRGTSDYGPLELEIPVQDVGKGETIHQLAAKKAVHELGQGRGWLTEVKVDDQLLSKKYEGRWDLMVEREAVRLGVEFQISGKWCSFVAVDQNDQTWNDDALTLNEEPIKEKSARRAPTGANMRFRKMASQQSGTFSAPNPVPLASPAFGFGSPAPISTQGSIALPPSPSMSSFSTSFANQRPALFGVTSNTIASHTHRQNSGGLFGSSKPAFGNLEQSSSLFGQPQEPGGASTVASGQTQNLFGSNSPNSLPPFSSLVSGFGAVESKTDYRVSTAPAPDFRRMAAPPPGSVSDTTTRDRSINAIDPLITDSLKGGMVPTSRTGTRVPQTYEARFSDRRSPPKPTSPPVDSCAKSSTPAKDEQYDPNEDMGFGLFDGPTYQMFGKAGVGQHVTDEPDSNITLMHVLIDGQKFDGWWEYSPSLVQRLGLDSAQLDQIDVGSPAKSKKEIQLTILLVAWLRKTVPEEKDVWEMIADKAINWLQQQLGSGCNANNLIDSAEVLITA